MVSPSSIEERIKELGFKTSRVFKPEVNELEQILMDDEKIIELAGGRYLGSFGLLVATNHRLLLIDKRLFFMTVEDTRYDMVSEIDFNRQIYGASVTIFTINKTHRFATVRYKKQLRALTNYVQRRVMELRNQQAMSDNEVSQLDAIRYSTPQRPLQEFDSQPTAQTMTPDYYAGSDYPSQVLQPVHILRDQASSAIHKMGAAALKATPWVSHHTNYRPHFMAQGSLLTRQQITSSQVSEY